MKTTFGKGSDYQLRQTVEIHQVPSSEVEPKATESERRNLFRDVPEEPVRKIVSKRVDPKKRVKKRATIVLEEKQSLEEFQVIPKKSELKTKSLLENKLDDDLKRTESLRRSIQRRSSSHPFFSYNNLLKDDPVMTEKITTDNKTYLRVIAPFLRMKNKRRKVDEEGDKKFSYYLERRPTLMLKELISDHTDIPQLLKETVEVLQTVTKADCSNVYFIDNAANEIYLMTAPFINDERFRVAWDIKEGTTVSASCALWKEIVMVDDLTQNYGQFPEGIGYEGDMVIQSVLCAPIITPDGHCVAVVELYTEFFSNKFTSDAVKIVTMVTGWMGAAMHQNQQRVALTHYQELNDYLLDLTKLYFCHHGIFTEKLIGEVVRFAKMTLGAERGSFFILDPESDELVANLFDESDKENEIKAGTKIRMSKERGIAGLVASTGVTVNIKDAYKDSRFNKDIDMKTGFITRSILCMPIMGQNGVMGVVQLINKKSGPCFTAADEELFKTFSMYCSMALHYSRLHTVCKKQQNLNNILKTSLKVHHEPCDHDLAYINSFLNNPIVRLPPGFHDFSWHIRWDRTKKEPFFCYYMFEDMCGAEAINRKNLMYFFLLMKKYYRPNPYHNFEHAFNVLHCMYLILKRNKNLFTEMERKAMLVAAIGHDVDHPGLTNGFLALSKHDLAQLYDSSYLENHHYNITVMLLEESGPIFKNFSPDDWEQLKAEVKEQILATDIPSYFRARALLGAARRADTFTIKNKQHRFLLKSIIITTCDLSAQCKPFLVAKRITDDLYEEFYRQGDLEKQLGQCPLSLMDREKMNVIPEDQIQFLNAIVLPCAALIKDLLPNTEDIYKGACAIKRTWIEIIQHRGMKVWRQCDSICR